MAEYKQLTLNPPEGIIGFCDGGKRFETIDGRI